MNDDDFNERTNETRNCWEKLKWNDREQVSSDVERMESGRDAGQRNYLNQPLSTCSHPMLLSLKRRTAERMVTVTKMPESQLEQVTALAAAAKRPPHHRQS